MTAQDLINRWIAEASLDRLQAKAEELRKSQHHQSPRDKEHTARLISSIGRRIKELQQ